MRRFASTACTSAGPTNAALLRNGVASAPSWVSRGAVATGLTVQNADAGPTGRMTPVTTSVWPAVWSREPTCTPSRAAVAAVTATWNVAEPVRRSIVVGR